MRGRVSGRARPIAGASRRDATPRARWREDAVSRDRWGSDTYLKTRSFVRSFDRSIYSLIHSFIVVNGRDDDDGVDGDARARVFGCARGGQGIVRRWCASCGGEDARAGRAMGGGGGAGGALAGDAGRDAGGELAEGLGRVRGVARQTTAE